MSFLKMLVIGRIFVASVSIISSTVLLFNNNDHWGWFLLVGIILAYMNGESKAS